MKNHFDTQEAVDATRAGPAPARGVRVWLDHPVTAAMARYPETCVVDVEPGGWPRWLRPYLGRLRRLQARHDPGYGFVTDCYTWLPATAYVATEPGDGRMLCRALLAAARAAGWIVDAGTNDLRFEAYERPARTALEGP